MARFNKAKKVVDLEAGNIRFDFANGESIVVNPAEYDSAIQKQGLLHGISQKIGDSYASAETAEEAYAAAKAVVAGLIEGKWTTRTVGESSGGSVTMLVEALYRVTKSDGRSMEACAELIGEMDDAQVEGLKKLPPIAAALDSIRAERALAKAEKSAKAAEAAGPLDLSSLTPA